MPTNSGSRLSRAGIHVLGDPSESRTLHTVATKIANEIGSDCKLNWADPDSLIWQKEVKGVIIGMAPGPTNAEGVHDLFLEYGSIRCLLGCPSAFVLLVTVLSRDRWNQQLRKWYETATGIEDGLPDSILLGPMGTAVITSDDYGSLDGSGITRVVNHLNHCFPSAKYDPTGLRSTVQLLVKTDPQYMKEQKLDRDKCAPKYAVVIDDERQVSDQHAYILRRKGYSVFAPRNVEQYDHVEEFYCRDRKDLKSSLPDVILVDEFIEFGSMKTGSPKLGSKYLKKIRSGQEHANDVIISGKVRTSDVVFLGRTPYKYGDVLPKPILDSFHLDRLMGVKKIPRVEPPGLRPNSHAVRQLREVAFALDQHAENRLKGNHSITAMICWLDCFELSRGCDGSLAARAIMRIHMEEARGLFDTYLDDWEENWKARLKSVIESVKDAFPEESKVEQYWWRMRVYNALLEQSGGTTLPRSSRISTEILLLEAKAKHLRHKYESAPALKNDQLPKTAESKRSVASSRESADNLVRTGSLCASLIKIDSFLTQGLIRLRNTPRKLKHTLGKSGIFLRVITLRLISNWIYVVGAYFTVVAFFTLIYMLLYESSQTFPGPYTDEWRDKNFPTVWPRFGSALSASLFASPEDYDILKSHPAIVGGLKYLQGVLYAATFGLAYGYFFERFLKRS